MLIIIIYNQLLVATFFCTISFFYPPFSSNINVHLIFKETVYAFKSNALAFIRFK
jgi:hypothetical protein